MTVTKIEAPWLQSPIVQRVVEALGVDNVRFVGGAVRDTLVGLDVVDIDAATRHTPDETLRLLKLANIKAIPTGLEHGTVTAVVDGETAEITTLRVDVETDGRHAEVVFTKDWLEDAKRRDLTFNALYVSADGTLFDPFGGHQDLLDGRVSFIGEAEDRIKEDGLRILRLFRFFAHFGKVPIETSALKACVKHASMLTELSIERVRTELAKLLKAENPIPTLQAMLDCNLFVALELSRVTLEKLQSLLLQEKVLRTEADNLLRLHQLFADSMSAGELVTWLKLSNKNKSFLLGFEDGVSAAPPATDHERRKFIYQYGNEVGSAIAITWGDEALYQIAEQWKAPHCPVQGRDLMAMGMLPGPEVGEALKRIEAKWLESDFQSSKEELLRQL